MIDSTSRSRVLVVDDAPVVCEALRYVIDETSDLEVVGEAREALDAIARAHNLNPDVVILDVHLPGMDGFAVARELKSMPDPPVIVFLTVDNTMETQQRSLEAGDALVTKAQGWDVLLAQIRFSLADHR